MDDGGATGQRHGVDSEVGRLRTVMLHRPGPELKRLTPRNNDKLLFDGIPWVGRAQDEHDAFADTLRGHGVEVLYLADLRPHLGGLHPDDLAQVLMAGLAHEELRSGRGLAFALMDRHDFVVDPLPNLLFTRDSSVRIGDHVAVTSLAMAARRRET